MAKPQLRLMKIQLPPHIPDSPSRPGTGARASGLLSDLT